MKEKQKAPEFPFKWPKYIPEAAKFIEWWDLFLLTVVTVYIQDQAALSV